MREATGYERLGGTREGGVAARSVVRGAEVTGNIINRVGRLSERSEDSRAMKRLSAE